MERCKRQYSDPREYADKPNLQHIYKQRPACTIGIGVPSILGNKPGRRQVAIPFEQQPPMFVFGHLSCSSFVSELDNRSNSQCLVQIQSPTFNVSIGYMPSLNHCLLTKPLRGKVLLTKLARYPSYTARKKSACTTDIF
jgi:hypothetical protein